ncbi:chorismate mutase-like protein [Prosthecobacter fusiformis]|uniref:chorismate mutase n=2 Tax=Prosthecobacter fusiformis TaxID=48464 RepID=A0A4R7RIV9_9BACT|nr:chorismate mutase-like protein [Prosthecobacter fusiformis]
MVGCAGSSRPQDDATLPKLMVERLSWMDEVVRVKQARSLPVTDAKREEELLVMMEREGQKAGLPAQAVREFFAGQITAAKFLQTEWLKKYPQGDPTLVGQPLPDLSVTVRPALDRLGKSMLTALAVSRQKQDSRTMMAAAKTELTEAGYSKQVIAAALEGLEAGLK